MVIIHKSNDTEREEIYQKLDPDAGRVKAQISAKNLILETGWYRPHNIPRIPVATKGFFIWRNAVSEHAPENSENRSDALRKRFEKAFPAVGGFMFEDLETDAKRESFLQQEGLTDIENQRNVALGQVIEQYILDDVDFLKDMDEDDRVSYVYGQLLEMGEDPDVILQEFGVTEESDEI